MYHKSNTIYLKLVLKLVFISGITQLDTELTVSYVPQFADPVSDEFMYTATDVCNEFMDAMENDPDMTCEVLMLRSGSTIAT